MRKEGLKAFHTEFTEVLTEVTEKSMIFLRALCEPVSVPSV
jgi:hypothetical protein